MTKRIASLSITSALVFASFAALAAPSVNPQLVKSQYDTIASQLETGGDLLVLANVDGLLEEMLANLVGLIDLAPANDPSTAQLRQVMARLPGFLKKNGFYAVEGFGLSSVPRADGLYNTRVFVSRKPQAATLPLWRGLVGSQPQRMACLDFLPRDAVLVQAGAGEVNQLWSIIHQGVSELGSKEVIDSFEKSMAAASAAMGVSLDQLLATIGSEQFFSVQLSSIKSVELPLAPGSAPVVIPAPSILIGMAVTNNTLLTVIERSLAKTGIPLQTSTVNGTKITGLPLPIPSPVPVQLTFAQHNGMFLFGSTEEVVTSAVEASTAKNGLGADPEFQKMFADLPLSNNGFSYVGKRLTETLATVQAEMLKAAATGKSKAEMDTIKRIMDTATSNQGPAASVTLNTKDGVLTRGIGPASGKQYIAATAIAPIGLLSAIAIPSFVKARSTSQNNACINNLRQLDGAKEQAAMAENWSDGTAALPGSANEKAILQYIKGGVLPTCPAGGTYTINPIGTDPTCSQPGHAL